MSEDPSPYFKIPQEDDFGPEFLNGQRAFIYEFGRNPTAAFICHRYRAKMREYIQQFPTITDKTLPDLPEGALGTYNGVVLYETSKPGITFA